MVGAASSAALSRRCTPLIPAAALADRTPGQPYRWRASGHRRRVPPRRRLDAPADGQAAQAVAQPPRATVAQFAARQSENDLVPQYRRAWHAHPGEYAAVSTAL